MPSRPSGSPSTAPPPGEPRSGGRYQRSAMGMVGAMLVVVVFVIGFMSVRALLREDASVPTKAIDPAVWIERGQQDGQLHIVTPSKVPAKWTVTSATYSGGELPEWRMGMLTDQKKFVGIVESADKLHPVLRRHIQDNPQASGRDTIGGLEWKRFTAAKGDGALIAELTSPKGKPEVVMVYGDVGLDRLADFVRTLPDLRANS